MNKTGLFKWIVCSCIMLLLGHTVYAQPKKDPFNAAVSNIRKKVACCSEAFPGRSPLKATAVLIFTGGEMTIVYNNGVPVSFNLFELYKDIEAPLGVHYKKGSSVVVFKIDETSSQAIRFNSTAKAQDVYNQLLLIFKYDKENYKPACVLTMGETVDSINTLLRNYNNDRAEIKLLNDTVFKVSQMPSMRYDIDVTKLKSSPDLNLFQVKGFSFIPHLSDAFGSGPRITFQHGSDLMGFLKFTSMGGEGPQRILRLLVHLSYLMNQRSFTR